MEADILNISPAMLNLIWLGLFILLLVIEIITVGLTTIWFAAGALGASGRWPRWRQMSWGRILSFRSSSFWRFPLFCLSLPGRGQRSISTENGSEQIMKERSGRLYGLQKK